MSRERDLERRIESLESTLTFQERDLSRLDEVLRTFAARVERLEEELARLRLQLARQQAANEGE